MIWYSAPPGAQKGFPTYSQRLSAGRAVTSTWPITLETSPFLSTEKISASYQFPPTAGGFRPQRFQGWLRWRVTVQGPSCLLSMAIGPTMTLLPSCRILWRPLIFAVQRRWLPWPSTPSCAGMPPDARTRKTQKNLLPLLRPSALKLIPP